MWISSNLISLTKNMSKIALSNVIDDSPAKQSIVYLVVHIESICSFFFSSSTLKRFSKKSRKWEFLHRKNEFFVRKNLGLPEPPGAFLDLEKAYDSVWRQAMFQN